MSLTLRRGSGAGWRWRLRAYAGIAAVAMRTLLIYRASLAISVAVLLVQIFALRVVWTWVYADRASVSGSGVTGEITLATQLAYVSLSTIQFWLFDQWSAYSLPRRIREGRVGADLVRPVGLLHQAVLGRLGTTVAALPFAVAALPFALLIGGAEPPADGAALAAYLASLLMALVIATLLSVLVEMIAFWTLEVNGFLLTYSLVSRFLSGSLVPLWFMPDWLGTMAGVLPFQATTYAPVAIYLGTVQGTDALRSLAVSLVWVALLWLLIRLVWTRAVRRIVVQGG